MDEVVVYYGEMRNLPIEEPKLLLSDLSKNDEIFDKNIVKCPSVKNFLKNTFIVYPNSDYEIEYTLSGIKSSFYDQKFFDKNVLCRDNTKGFVSYKEPEILFFADENTLNLELLPPFFHSLSAELKFIPGVFNIGKHLRPLELPIVFNKPSVLQIFRENPLYYVKFLTTRKIKLKRFMVTKELTDLYVNMVYLRGKTKKTLNLEFYYDLVEKIKYKKKYLSIIKQNLF